jgi:hypothetical protein
MKTKRHTTGWRARKTFMGKESMERSVFLLQFSQRLRFHEPPPVH